MVDNLLASKQASKREVWIDILRGIGILLVVLGHTSPPFLLKIIYGFHMPLFFMIAGYLWKPKTILDSLRRYILPYFLLCGINLVLNSGMLLLQKKSVPMQKYFIGILYSRGTTEWMPNCSPLWFLTGLFCAFMLYDSIQAIKSDGAKSILIICSGVLSGMLSYLRMFKLPWNIDTALMGIVFIHTGYMIRHLNVPGIMNRIPNAKEFLFLASAVIIGIIAIIYNPIDSVNFDNNRYGNVILMLIGAVLICLVLFIICRRIQWKGSIAKYISWLGLHTIFIMGFDYFTGTIARSILGYIGFENWASVFVVKVLLLTVGCLGWNWAVRKIGNKSIRQALSF